MTIDEQAAAVDTDFLCHMCETKGATCKPFELVVAFFRDLKVQPIVHPLIWKNEMPNNNTIMALLFEHEIILQPTFEDILQHDTEKTAYYSFLVEELYFKLSGGHLEEIHVDDIFTDWVRDKNLGEIHSVSMCLICKCGIFLSDDSDSKRLKHIVEVNMLTSIMVYNRSEACRQLKECEGTQLSRDDLRALSHRA